MAHSSSTSYPMIAPCGMNCSVCMAYLRDRNVCPGCWGDDLRKPDYCTRCIIKNCALLAETSSKFCFECSKYPCLRLKQLDKRYRVKYHTSLLENLQLIKNKGIEIFISMEKNRWKCPECGGTICIHRGYCLKCKTTLLN